jgi:hypothetical protein
MEDGHKREWREIVDSKEILVEEFVMSAKDETCDYVDDFIRDLLSGNVEIDYNKAKGLFAYKKEKSFWGSEKRTDKEEFSSVLGIALTEYQLSKTTEFVLQQAYATKCFKYMVWGNTFHVIKRTGLANKIEELKKENSQLKEEKDKLEKENRRLSQLNDALQSTFDKLGFQRISNDEDSSGEKL